MHTRHDEIEEIDKKVDMVSNSATLPIHEKERGPCPRVYCITALA